MTAVAAPPWLALTSVPVAAPLRAVDWWRSSGDVITARVRVDPADPNLRGHFPGFAIYPGVFVVETLCQVMTAAFAAQQRRPRLRTVRSLRFLAPLLADDELTLDINLTPTPDGGWRVRAQGSRLDGVAAAQLRAEFDDEVAA